MDYSYYSHPLLQSRATTNTTTTTTTSSSRNWRVGCHAWNPLVRNAFGYRPSLAAGIVFVVLFFIITTAHIVQVGISRKWWYLVFVAGALGELLGWAARLAAHSCPYNQTLFLIQIAVLIFSPSFFSAGIYYILGRLMSIWGSAYTLIPAKRYLFIFLGVDVASLVVQACGGGLASSASARGTSTKPGTDVMIVGIVIQLASMLVFMVFFIGTVWKARGVSMTADVKRLLWATVFSSAVIVVRNIYRTVELAQGWSGYLIRHEVYFAVFDGAMMVLAVGVFNVFHPAWMLKGEEVKEKEKVEVEMAGGKEVGDAGSPSGESISSQEGNHASVPAGHGLVGR